MEIDDKIYLTFIFSLVLVHPVLNCKYLHYCWKQILEQCIQ